MNSNPISAHNARDLRKLAEFQRIVTAVALSPDNQHVACGADENVGFIVKNPDGSIGNDGSVTLLDYLNTEMVAKFPTTRQGDRVFSLAYDSSGRYLACAAGDSLYVWDIEKQDLVLKRPDDWMDVMLGDLRFVDGGQESNLLFARRDRVQVLDTSRWQVVDGWRCWQGVDAESQVLAPDASRVGTLNSDKKLVAVWNLQTSRLEWSHTLVETHITPSRALCFHPLGTLLAVGETSRITVWQLPQGELVSELRFERGLDADALAFSRDGRLLAAGLLQLTSEQGSNGDWEVYGSYHCTLWDWEWGAQLAQLPGVGSSLAFSADGSRLAAAHGYGVQIWAAG
jgi:WD40 repeat protein